MCELFIQKQTNNRKPKHTGCDAPCAIHTHDPCQLTSPFRRTASRKYTCQHHRTEVHGFWWSLFSFASILQHQNNDLLSTETLIQMKTCFITRIRDNKTRPYLVFILLLLLFKAHCVHQLPSSLCPDDSFVSRFAQFLLYSLTVSHT